MSLNKYYSEMREGFYSYVDEAGETGELFREHYDKTYEAGAFDVKTKRLMAMVGAIAHGCDGCIIGQTKRALENGATRAEVIEACTVAFSLGGTMAGTKVSIVKRVIDEAGLK